MKRLLTPRARTTTAAPAFDPLEPRRLMAGNGFADNNDQISEAAHVDFRLDGASRSASISAPQDVDMYEVDLLADVGYTFRLDPIGDSPLEGLLTMFDGDGFGITFGPPVPNAPGSSKIFYRPSEDQTVYIGASNSMNIDYDCLTGDHDTDLGTSGEYRLSFDYGSSNNPTDTNDQLREATFINVGVGTSSFAIDSTRDVDMFRFDVTAGQTISFDIDRPAGSVVDAHLRLFNAAGEELNASGPNNQAPGEPGGIEPFIEYHFPADGTFYLGVSARGNDAYDAMTGAHDATDNQDADGGAFILRVDVGDLNGSFQTPISSAIQTNKRGKIDFVGDVDVFRFDVHNAGQVVTFDMDHIGQNAVAFSRLELFDRDGNMLATNNVSGQGAGESIGSGEPYLEHRFDEAGAYFVRVQGRNGQTGDYELRTRGNDLNNNPTPNSASFVPVGFAPVGAMEYAGDVDVYRFNGTAGQVVTIDIDGLGGGFIDLRIINTAGQQFTLADTDEASRETPNPSPYTEFQPIADGDHYLVLTNLGGPLPGDYIVRVLEGDQNDTLVTSSLVGSKRSLKGNIRFKGDVDLFEFEAPSNGRYGFDVDTNALVGQTNVQTLDSVLRLFDSNGNQIAFSDDDVAPGDDSPFRESYIETDLAAGRYFIGVSGFPNSSYNPITGDGDNTGNNGYATGVYTLNLTNLNSPEVVAHDVELQTEQSISVTVNAQLDPASISSSDLLLRNTTTGDTIPPSRFDVDLLDNGSTVKFTYDISSHGPLPSGDYSVEIQRGSLRTVGGDNVETFTTEFDFLRGDANGDRRVNLSDFVILRNHFGQSGQFRDGDFNYDGTVDLSDFVILRNHFGSDLDDPDSIFS